MVASLAYSAAESFLATLDDSSPRYQQVLERQEFAEANLPRVLPSETDIQHDGEQSRPVSMEHLHQRLSITERRGQQVKEWSVGVTTAPRRQETLAKSCQGLLDCGWSDPHLFIDGSVEVDSSLKELSFTRRSSPIGAWQNFMLGLTELVEAHPNSDAYLMVQDDVLWPAAPDLKEYLSEFLWPTKGNCIVSLYTSVDDEAQQEGWRPLADLWKYGALAFVFPRTVARRMTCDPRLRSYGWTHGSGVAGVDTAIGKWAQKKGVPIWHPTPSLVQHFGHVSSIWSSARAVGLRRAGSWVGDKTNP